MLEGRDAELEILLAALLRARRSPQQLIWVSGDAGVGKTALATQLREPAERAGGRFVQGKCEQFADGKLLQAPRQALAQLLLELEACPEPARSRLVNATRQALGPDGGALLPLLPELQAITGPLPEPTSVEPYEQPRRLLSLLVALLRVLAHHSRMLVLVLDDLHWADPLTLALIAALLEAPDLSGLLLLGLFRQNELEPRSGLAQLLARAAERPAPPLQLELANLGKQPVERLLAWRLRSQPHALTALSEALWRSTGGNPFFVHQLVNALQREGLLSTMVSGQRGVHGQPSDVLQRLGSGDVVAFLSRCLSQLPQPNLELLQCLAILGSQANLALLAQASGEPLPLLRERLQPALELGVLVCTQPDHLATAEPETLVLFGHDRLQQAVADLSDPIATQVRQLAMARRLHAAGHRLLAAQYFAASTTLLTSQAERRRVAALLRQAGTAALQQGSFATAERFLKQALVLLGPEAWQRHPGVSFELQRHLHQLAYCHADYERVDALYGELQRRARSPHQLLEPAAIQVMALSNRCHYQAAVELVADLLAQLGSALPLHQPQQALEQELEGFIAMVHQGGLETLPPLPARPPAGRSTAKLLNRLVPAAFFCNPPLACWLVLHSTRQWHAGDAHPARLYPLACTLLASVPARGDYSTGYRAARIALALGEASPHGLETARTRHVFSLFCQHWFEPLEQALAQARLAHRDQERSGEVEFACYALYTTQAAVLEMAQDLSELAQENQRALDFARRTCNRHAEPAFTAYSDLLAALQERPCTSRRPLPSLELAELEKNNPMAACYHHSCRALAAALLGDSAALRRHAEAACELEPYITGFYPAALNRLLRGLALVEQLRQTPNPAAAASLQELEAWFVARAADAPQNFAHLAELLQAERLAAEGCGLEALQICERALRSAVAHQRPWHAAFICERAGRMYLGIGLEQAGQRLLEQAQQRYANWGATRKTEALSLEFPYLRAATQASDQLTQLLHASQQLGGLHTVADLAQATAALIARHSGATDVQIVVLDREELWQLKGGISPRGPLRRQSLEEAEQRVLLPASALRLCLQRLQPLMTQDAVLDPRFSGDPFIQPLDCCSLLVVPVLVQQRPIAVAIAAHRQQRGAFVADLARSVEVLCGQLAVALENLLIQRSLEQQVRERSQALEQAYARETRDEEQRRKLMEQKLKTSLTAAAVAHEIQQPLAAILLKCRLAEDDLAALPTGSDASDLQQRLLSLSADAQQVVHTMERMRMLLRNVETEHSHVDLTTNLHSALVFLQGEIKAHQVQLSHEGLEQPCHLQGDGAQLQMAAVNLIRNALQALEAQPAASRRILVQLQRHPTQLRVVVADSGPGFAADHSSDVSWELLKSSKATGMGLGLFLAETAATNHRGQLRIGRSRQLGGAEVVIELPR